MKKLLFILTALFIIPAYAGVYDKCLSEIQKTDSIWQDLLFSKTNGIFKDISDNEEITNDLVQSRRQQIYKLLALDTLLVCNKDLGIITEQGGRAEIDFKHDNKTYSFDFDVKTMMNYTDTRLGILVVNDKTKKPGDVILKSEMPRDYFWPQDCSDYYIALNLDDNAPVNLAGQSVFGEFGGSRNEFFLDFPVGSSCRAFPGLVLMDKTNSTAETIVSYRNVVTGAEKIKAFTDRLHNTSCSSAGLAAYLVALDIKKDTASSNAGWMIAAGVTGGAMAWLGTSALLMSSLVTLPTWGIIQSGILSSALLSSAAAASAVPVAGWIAAGVLATGAAAIALYPSEIEDIKQVMVLSGPYNI